MCLLYDDNRVLLSDVETMQVTTRDKVVPAYFYRVLGGTVEQGEVAEEAVRREIREEIGTEIEDLEFLDVIENIFEYAGEPNHEIVFLFKGKPADRNLLKQDVLHVVEDGYEFDAVWVSTQELLEGDKPLNPKADYSKWLV